MFQAVPLSIIMSFSLYTQQWYVTQVCWHLARKLSAKWKTHDDGKRNCLKHVEFHSKNKFEKLVHIAGFIIRIYQSVGCAGMKGTW